MTLHVVTLTHSYKNTQGLLSFANATDHPVTRENILDTNNRNVITEKTLKLHLFSTSKSLLALKRVGSSFF